MIAMRVRERVYEIGLRRVRVRVYRIIE